MEPKIIQAFLMSVIAGIALVTGGIMPLVLKKIRKPVLPLILSFTGGIMLYVAFVKFLPAANAQLETVFEYKKAFRITTLVFFGGLLATVPIDMILAYFQRKFKSEENLSEDIRKRHEHKLFSFIFLSITMHNFFEGIAAFLTYFSEEYIAFPVVLSIIAHNIPEGMVIAMVIFKKSKNKRKAILFCLISAIAEPLGAVGTYLFLHESMTPVTFGMVKAFLAGLLVNTALDELIPGADLKGGHQLSMKGIIGGMLFMAILMMTAY
ncbi:MAG: ZIP family metal transporter [Bacteroidales bacterium]